MGWGTRTSLLGLLAFSLVLTLALAPAAQAKRIVGTNSANVLKGTNVRDRIFGRDGKDVLIGFAAADYVYGEEGDDILLGESGNDRLWGGGRDDTLDGGTGADRLWPGWGSDVVDAGSGNDIVNAGENDSAMDSIDCGGGFDRAVINRRDKVFNCERVTRLRGRTVPGNFSHQAEATSGADVLDISTWYGRDFVDALGRGRLSEWHTARPTCSGGTSGTTGSTATTALTASLAAPAATPSGEETAVTGSGPALASTSSRDRWTTTRSSRSRTTSFADQITCGAGRDRVIVRSNDWVAPAGLRARHSHRPLSLTAS